MLAGKVAAALVMALVIGQVQTTWCAASRCVLESFEPPSTEQNTSAQNTSEQNLPPCHRSHAENRHQSQQDSSSHSHAPMNVCAHDAATAALISPLHSASAPVLAVFPTHRFSTSSRDLAGVTTPFFIASPPGFSSGTTTVLRI